MRKSILIILVLLISIGTWAGVKTAPDTGENSKAFDIKAKKVFIDVNAVQNVIVKFDLQNHFAEIPTILTVNDEVAVDYNYKAVSKLLPKKGKAQKVYRRARDGVPTM